MADLKKRTLMFSSGRQLKLFGNSIAIGKSLEIGEGYAPNIFSLMMDQDADKSPGTVSNPYRLTGDELQELADFNIRLWMDLKDNIRKHGIDSARIFNRDATL